MARVIRRMESAGILMIINDEKLDEIFISIFLVRLIINQLITGLKAKSTEFRE